MYTVGLDYKVTRKPRERVLGNNNDGG